MKIVHCVGTNRPTADIVLVLQVFFPRLHALYWVTE